MLVPGRPAKVARFIAAEAAQSGLSLAEDGKLPELRLREPGDAPGKEVAARGMNPLVLFGLMSLSFVASLGLLFMPTDSGSSGRGREKQLAREVIESDYFAELTDELPHYPYQMLLREAQRAHSRRDWKQERALYRRALDMLRAQPARPGKNLTGSAERDRILEEKLTILLSD